MALMAATEGAAAVAARAVAADWGLSTGAAEAEDEEASAPTEASAPKEATVASEVAMAQVALMPTAEAAAEAAED